MQNTDTTIKQSDNVADYIFCSKCESQLGIIEGECINKLDKLTQQIIQKDQNLKVEITVAGNQRFVLQKPGRKALTVFFYSVIWRQILNNEFAFGPQFPAEFTEALRRIIYDEIYKPLDKIEDSQNYPYYPDLIILTTNHETSAVSAYTYNPNPISTNPELFTIGEYECLIFTSRKKVSDDFSEGTFLPKTIIDPEFIINKSNTGTIGYIDHDLWDNKNLQLFQKGADDMIASYVKEIVNETDWPYKLAEQNFRDNFNTLIAGGEIKDYVSGFKAAKELTLKRFKDGVK